MPCLKGRWCKRRCLPNGRAGVGNVLLVAYSSGCCRIVKLSDVVFFLSYSNKWLWWWHMDSSTRVVDFIAVINVKSNYRPIEIKKGCGVGQQRWWGWKKISDDRTRSISRHVPLNKTTTKRCLVEQKRSMTVSVLVDFRFSIRLGWRIHTLVMKEEEF